MKQFLVWESRYWHGLHYHLTKGKKYIIVKKDGVRNDGSYIFDDSGDIRYINNWCGKICTETAYQKALRHAQEALNRIQDWQNNSVWTTINRETLRGFGFHDNYYDHWLYTEYHPIEHQQRLMGYWITETPCPPPPPPTPITDKLIKELGKIRNLITEDLAIVMSMDMYEALQEESQSNKWRLYDLVYSNGGKPHFGGAQVIRSYDYPQGKFVITEI